jgi:hypothetical protein
MWARPVPVLEILQTWVDLLVNFGSRLAFFLMTKRASQGGAKNQMRMGMMM